METIREARLRREAADRYPFIPVRMWTQAARMAELVRKHLEGCGRRVRARRRALAEGDFRFRGGLRHPPGAHTRLTDPEPAQRHVAPDSSGRMSRQARVTRRVRDVVPDDPAGQVATRRSSPPHCAPPTSAWVTFLGARSPDPLRPSFRVSRHCSAGGPAANRHRAAPGVPRPFPGPLATPPSRNLGSTLRHWPGRRLRCCRRSGRRSTAGIVR